MMCCTSKYQAVCDKEMLNEDLPYNFGPWRSTFKIWEVQLCSLQTMFSVERSLWLGLAGSGSPYLVDREA